MLTAPQGKAVETAARDAGFLVNAAAPDVIRLAPPLVVTDAQIDAFLTALPAILDTAAEAHRDRQELPARRRPVARANRPKCSLSQPN